VDIGRALGFMRQNRRAILATRRRDGGPQMSPVVIGVDDAGRVLISSREPAYKVRNLRRDPRAALCVIPDSFFGEWIQASGSAEIVTLPAAMELLVDYYRRVAGEHKDWDDYRAAMQRERRLIIRISIERAGPDKAG
jgi:PPOX class probable F420-dependent enzyme